MGKSVQANGFKGMLGTAWNQFSGRYMQEVFHPLAHVCWNQDFDFRKNIDNMPVFNTHLREVDQDMKIRTYEQFGRINRHQLPPDKM